MQLERFENKQQIKWRNALRFDIFRLIVSTTATQSIGSSRDISIGTVLSFLMEFQAKFKAVCVHSILTPRCNLILANA